MKIGILGAGVIGQTLGKKWAAAGHDIVFGVRNLENPELNALRQSLTAYQASTTVGSTNEAIAFGEVILFAIPGRVVAEVAKNYASMLDGKVLIDAANHLGGEALNSVAEIQTYCPAAAVFRAFNTLGWENFAEPTLSGLVIDLFYAGPRGEPQQILDNLIYDVGLNPIYVGGPNHAATVDGLTRLWFALAFEQRYGRRLAFKLLSEPKDDEL